MRHLGPRLLAVGLLCSWCVPVTAAWPASSGAVGQIADLLRHLVAVAQVQQVGQSPILEPELLLRLYRERDFRPAWMDRNGVYLEAADLLSLLGQAPDEGLRRSDYHYGDLTLRLKQATTDPLVLAQLDLLLTDAYLHYARDLLLGPVSPERLDATWMRSERRDAAIPRRSTEPTLVPADLTALDPKQPAFERLRLALRRYRAIAVAGGWPELAGGVELRPGMRDPRLPVLRRRLALEGYEVNPPQDPQYYGSALAAAVRRFQRHHGLHADARVGRRTRAALNVSAGERAATLTLNIARWRWLPRHWPQRYILVNMTDYRLTLVDGRGEPLRMRVIIGREGRPTPVFRSAVNAVVVNPSWYVPDTILREDLLPALRRDPALLQRLGMQVLQHSQGQWQAVNAQHIDWGGITAAHFPYTLRQGPGAHNALGRFKFIMPDTRSIYLHDTSKRQLFAREGRALSSGCVRVEKPEALALRMLEEDAHWDRQRLDTLVADGRSRVLHLKTPWPVFLMYWTAWVDEDGAVNFRDDIYGRDKVLLSLAQG